MDAIKALSTGLGLPAEASSSLAARSGPPRRDAHGVEYEDRVSLSGEVRIRLDVTRGIEGTRAEGGGDDRMSPEQRERIRELFATDMSVRAEASRVPAGEEPLRGLPSYEVELGPDGRAYAVEPGVEFEVEPTTERQRCAEAYRSAAELPSDPDDYGTVTRRHFTRV